MRGAKEVIDLLDTYLHLDDGPDAVRLPVGDDFWEKLPRRDDLGPGRLVATFRFAEDWTRWEMHPEGDEVVVLLSGAMDLVLEEPSGERVVPLRAGTTCIVPKGVWHTATVHEPSEALHITRGAGTRHRPR